MAPADRDPFEPGRERKLRAVLDFSNEIYNTLPDAVHEETVQLLLQAELEHNIQDLAAINEKSKELTLSERLFRSLERQGRDLWNLCLRLKRDRFSGSEASSSQLKLLADVRLLSFFMLSIGRHGAKSGKEDSYSNAIYMLNLALTATRTCLQDSELSLARQALQKAGCYADMLKLDEFVESFSAEAQRAERLQLEYMGMRLALSWKEDRLDIAENTFNWIWTNQTLLDSNAAEMIASILQSIGAGFVQKKDCNMAIKWLGRAQEVITSQYIEDLSADGLELWLAIYQGLFQVYSEQGTSEALKEAENIVTMVENQLGDRPIVLHWRLDLLSKAPKEELHDSAYASILRRLIKAFDDSEATLHYIMHHITALWENSKKLSIALLDELLLQRVIPSGIQNHIAKALIRRIWFASMNKHSESAMQELSQILSDARDGLKVTVEPEIAGAAQSLLWKKVESAIMNENFQEADAWCRIALHEIFASAGNTNLGKLGRKRILCAIHLNDAEMGREAFQSMPEICQRDPLTSYLMFRLSLVSYDHEMGQRSIKLLGEVAEKNHCQDMLYACIKEAQHAGDKVCTLIALKQVIESWHSDGKSNTNYPAMLRCTIRLLHLVEEETGDHARPEETAEYIEDLCNMFDKGVAFARADPRAENGSKIMTITELNWFRKNAYNIGVTKAQTLDLPLVIRIFKSCVAFTDWYPENLPLSDFTEIALMAMRCHFIIAACHFIIAAALISMARTEDRIEEQLQRYVEARQHVSAFDKCLQIEGEAQPEEVTKDLIGKAAALFVFDFEGAVALKSWDELNNIVRKATMCQDETTFKAMGDCLLRSHAPGRIMFGTLGLIINEIFTLEGFDVARIAKYMRCLFQAVLPLEDTLAIQVLDQAIQVAKEGKEKRRSFPAEEMEWLVASTFNHAVDYYARREQEACHRWGLKAIDLSRHADDGGSLCNTLQERFAKLQF